MEVELVTKVLQKSNLLKETFTNFLARLTRLASDTACKCLRLTQSPTGHSKVVRQDTGQCRTNEFICKWFLLLFDVIAKDVIAIVQSRRTKFSRKANVIL